MKKTIAAALAAVLAVFVLACASPSAPKTAPFSPIPPSDVVKTSAAATPGTTTPPPATPAATKAAGAPTIDDGTWTVGEDVPAGTYKTVGSGADCYWSITKSGTNGADIINNHVGGGNLRVVLKAGQDFQTARCGTWVKQQ